MPQTTQILRQQNLGDPNPPPGAHFGAMVVPQHTTPPYIGRTQRANISRFWAGGVVGDPPPTPPQDPGAGHPKNPLASPDSVAAVRGGLCRFWEPQILGHVHIIHPGTSSGVLDYVAKIYPDSTSRPHPRSDFALKTFQAFLRAPRHRILKPESRKHFGGLQRP